MVDYDEIDLLIFSEDDTDYKERCSDYKILADSVDISLTDFWVFEIPICDWL